MVFQVPIDRADQIATFALYSDKSADFDLKRRIIDSKKEYISGFTKRFTGFLNGPLSSGLSAESIQVPHKNKKKSGCDTTIIITSKELSKIAITNYNYLNFENPSKGWDRYEKSTGKSLFTTKLNKQQKYTEQFAVFLKFINNEIKCQHQQMIKESANCVWHSDAMSFYQENNNAPESLWDIKRVLDMFRATDSMDIGTVLRALCLDSEAVPVYIDNGIEDYIRAKNLPSRVISINVLD